MGYIAKRNAIRRKENMRALWYVVKILMQGALVAGLFWFGSVLWFSL